MKASAISKADGHLVVAMRVYPRFLPRGLTDEYTRSLAPDAALFGRYRAIKKQSCQQNLAFQAAGYEQSFALSQEGMDDLARLASVSSRRNVFLICQCDRDEYCHVDLLLLMAECHFGARPGELPHRYEAFRERLRSVPGQGRARPRG